MRPSQEKAIGGFLPASSFAPLITLRTFSRICSQTGRFNNGKSPFLKENGEDFQRGKDSPSFNFQGQTTFGSYLMLDARKMHSNKVHQHVPKTLKKRNFATFYDRGFGLVKY